MPRWTERFVGRWRDRAAVRSELELEPTLRRRFDRLPDHLHHRRVLRAERRLRIRPDIGDAARMAESDLWRRSPRSFR